MRRQPMTVILPAYNEEQAIGQVIEEIRAKADGCQILVVDNGSTDMTREIVRAKDARLIVEPARGKGNAMRTGIRAAADNDGYVFMMDSDGTYPAGHILRMAHLLDLGHDVVIGHRCDRMPEAMTRVNLVGNTILTWLANRLYGTRIHDLCTGMWGFRSDILRDLTVSSNSFTLEAELFCQIVKKGYRYTEEHIVYRKRQGKAKLRMFDGFRIAWFLIARRLKP